MSVQPRPEQSQSQQSDANIAGYHHHHHHHNHPRHAPHTSLLDQQQHQTLQPGPLSDLASTTASPHVNGTAHLAVFPTNLLGTNSDTVAHDIGEGPPAKRRKLSIRGKKLHSHYPTSQPQQTTLDRFTFTQAPSTFKPADKLAVARPHGQLHDSINGVHHTPNLRDDALQNPTVVTNQQGYGSDGTVQCPIEDAVPQPIERSKSQEKPKSKMEDKRSLRSHDEGPRLKSELAVYFPNYEEIIFDITKEEEFIGFETALYITDDAPKPSKTDDATPSKPSKVEKGSPTTMRRTSTSGITFPVTPQRTNSNQLNGCPILNLDFAAKTLPEKPEDPLSNEHYFKLHRRAERKEKQLRNIERERAMHEKVQLERLLDALQGYDWLRVLGITGITDSEAKKYEPKRDFFVSEVQALVDKFKEWREQEKKQKIEKEAAVVAREEDEEESLEGSVDPPSSDLNASAARQLQQETFNALKSSSFSKSSSKAKERSSLPRNATPTRAIVLPLAPPSPEVPITSFYDKRHLRDAALGKSRHGRNVTAFGHAVPEMNEVEFELPSDYVTEDALRANARERRRRKRDAVTNTPKRSADATAAKTAV